MKSVKKAVKLLSRALVIAGALNWGLLAAFDVDLVRSAFGSSNAPLVYLLVGLAGLLFAMDRDFYLPFLGHAVFPCEPLAEKTPEEANVSVTVRVKPNCNVVFWAAEEGEAIVDDPWTAYAENSNSGVTRSDAQGNAVLSVRSPAAYRVPMKGLLRPHIHYRVCKKPGMLGPVKTVMLA